jgi:hypothetical protein
MRAALAVLLLILSTTFAVAECADSVSAMRQVNMKYRVAAGELRMLSRDLGPAGYRSEEAVLRSLRRYTLAQRDLREQRLQIIALYRSLVNAGCEPFDQQGYEATLEDFRTTTEAEERVLSEARRIMANTSDFR